MDDRIATKRRWRLTAGPDGLVIAAEDGAAAWTIRRADAARDLRLVAMGEHRYLGIQQRGGKPIAVDRETWDWVWAWRGPLDGRDLRQLLGASFWPSVIVGGLFAALSVPMEGDPAAGIEALPGSPALLALGLSLVALAVAGRFRPHPALIAIDAAWCVTLAIYTVVGVASGESHPGFLALAIALLALAAYRVRQYRRMRHIRAGRAGGVEA